MTARHLFRRRVLATAALGSGIVAVPQLAGAVDRLAVTPATKGGAEREGGMTRVEVRPGVVIAYEDEWFGAPWQDGIPIVLLHGVAESNVAWQQWVPQVAARFRMIRPDLPGFGQSPFPAAYDCGPQQIGADLIKLLDTLKINSFHLVGAKYGGSVALRIAADFPDRVKTLAVFGAPVKGQPGGEADLTSFADRIRKDGVRGWAAATQAARLGGGASSEMMRWWTDELMGKSDPAACIAYTTAAGDIDLEPLLGKITAPTFVVTTEASPLQPVAAVRAYQRKIATSKLMVVPGDSYHIAAVRPHECAVQLLQFIASA